MDEVAFAALVKRKRGALGLSQQALAERIWDDPGRKGDISRIENARVTPQEQTIQFLCQALGITDAELDPIRMARASARQLDQIPTLSRDELELLAGRFALDRAYDRSDADLRQFLTQKAEEYRRYKSLIDGLDERVAAIGNLKGAAQDAADRLDFDTVEALLARVTAVEAQIFAESCEARAANALLRNQVDQAATILTAGADALAVVDPLEPARRKAFGYWSMLYVHGRRYGGRGLTCAVAMSEAALTVLPRDTAPLDWAKALGHLAIVLRNLASRRAGDEGITLLTRAIAAYEDALTVTTRADHPLQWAMTQQNLAGALQTLASRSAGDDAIALLTRAIAAYEDALTVRTRADHPLDWAMTQQNLANALGDLANRTEGTVALALFARAIAAFEEALTVRTRADHPAQWAMTQENMAMTHCNWAAHPACADPRPHLVAALDHVAAALEVYDPVHMSHDHGTATALQAELRTRLAAL